MFVLVMVFCVLIIVIVELGVFFMYVVDGGGVLERRLVLVVR